MSSSAPVIAVPHKELPHDLALDGIRGLAILLVVGRHLISINEANPSALYLLAREIRDSFFCGVDLFFALSGFLITRILIRTIDDPRFFKNFYARRSLRIFPLYYGVLLVLIACTPLLHIHWGPGLWRLLTYSNNLFDSTAGTGFHFYFGGLVSLVNFWSLHIEEQFYFVWPLFVFLFRAPRRLLPLALALSLFALILRIVLFAHGYSGGFLYTSLITRMDSLLIGACLALVLLTRHRAAALRVATPVFVLAFACCVFIMAREYRPNPDYHLILPLQFTAFATASTALIAMALKHRSRTAAIFRAPALRFFGKYSYGLYVFHTVLPMFYTASLASALSHIPNRAFANILSSVVELLLAIAVSMLSYRFFEMPFLKLKKFFPYSEPHAPSPGLPRVS